MRQNTNYYAKIVIQIPETYEPENRKEISMTNFDFTVCNKRNFM